MRENYTMLDGNAPKKGLKINYLPSYDYTTQIYRYTTLNLYCPSVQQTDTYCIYTQQSPTN